MSSSEALLTITSAEGGEYTCDLRGEAFCRARRARLHQSAPRVGHLKNVMQTPAEFSFMCDRLPHRGEAEGDGAEQEGDGRRSLNEVTADMKRRERVSGKLTVSAPLEGFTQPGSHLERAMQQ